MAKRGHILRFSTRRLLAAMAILAFWLAVLRPLGGFGRRCEYGVPMFVHVAPGSSDGVSQELVDGLARRLLAPDVLDGALARLQTPRFAGASNVTRAWDPRVELQTRLRSRGFPGVPPRVWIDAWGGSNREANALVWAVIESYIQLDGDDRMSPPACGAYDEEPPPPLDRWWKLGLAVLPGLSFAAGVLVVPRDRPWPRSKQWI